MRIVCQHSSQPADALALGEVLIDDDSFEESKAGSVTNAGVAAALDHHLGHHRRPSRRAADDSTAFKELVQFLLHERTAIRSNNAILIATAEPDRRRLADRLS